MIFSLNELVGWLGLTSFEIFTNLISLTFFTVFLALKLDNDLFVEPSGWWKVFSPLYIADGLNTYFCTIIFIRTHMEQMTKYGILRGIWSLLLLSLIFTFKYLLCQKLSGQTTYEYSEVLSPIFILLQVIAVRACQLHWDKSCSLRIHTIILPNHLPYLSFI